MPGPDEADRRVGHSGPQRADRDGRARAVGCGPGQQRHAQACRDQLADAAQVAALRGVADGLGITPGQLALAWLLAQGDDVVPIPGSRHPVRIAENAAAAGVRLSPADLARLEAVVPRAAWAGDRRSFAPPATTRSAGAV